MAFQKAKREQIYAKIALIGASGSGKSYSALRLATGIVRKMGGGAEIYYIDTEGGRGKYYANEFDYNYMEITEPFTTEKYIKAIEDAVSAGNCGALIIDSTTHAWAGKGGILEQHSKMPGNSYTNWATLTPKYNKFVDEILLAKTYTITTVRGKDEYILEDKDGKKVPKKVGLGGEIRQNFEYEMTIAFNIDQTNHVATATKDNTHLFENRYDVLTEKDGEAIFEWANSGEKVAPTPKKETPSNTNKSDNKTENNTVTKEKTITDYISDIDVIAKKMAKIDADKLKETIKTHNNDKSNYSKVTDIEIAKKILSALQELEKSYKTEENINA